MNHADTLSLFPLDSRCTLLTNLVWDLDKNGVPCLSRQKLWVGFPAPVPASGLTAEFGAPVGRVRFETAEDEAGARWRVLADGLDPRQFIRFAAEQYLRDVNSSAAFSNGKHFPTVASGLLDCAWLYIASSGDWMWARRWREPILLFPRALLEMEYEGCGLAAADYSGVPEETGFMTARPARGPDPVALAGLTIERGLAPVRDPLMRSLDDRDDDRDDE